MAQYRWDQIRLLCLEHRINRTQLVHQIRLPSRKWSERLDSNQRPFASARPAAQRRPLLDHSRQFSDGLRLHPSRPRFRDLYRQSDPPVYLDIHSVAVSHSPSPQSTPQFIKRLHRRCRHELLGRSHSVGLREPLAGANLLRNLPYRHLEPCELSGDRVTLSSLDVRRLSSATGPGLCVLAYRESNPRQPP